MQHISELLKDAVSFNESIRDDFFKTKYTLQVLSMSMQDIDTKLKEYYFDSAYEIETKVFDYPTILRIAHDARPLAARAINEGTMYPTHCHNIFKSLIRERLDYFVNLITFLNLMYQRDTQIFFHEKEKRRYEKSLNEQPTLTFADIWNKKPLSSSKQDAIQTIKDKWAMAITPTPAKLPK